MSGDGRSGGFSVVELVVAMGLSLGVTLIACRLATGAQETWRVTSARADLQQRARAVADVLGRALLEAGGGPHAGSARGSLARRVPPILPRRVGARDADAPAVVRRDVFTTIRASVDASAAVLLTAAPPGAGSVELDPSIPCGPACGITAGTTVLLLDDSGASDLFTVTDAVGPVLSVRHLGVGSSHPYRAGSAVVPVHIASYWVDAAARLHAYNGDLSDLPLADDVVSMDVRLFGDVRPPSSPRPAPGEENCLYAADGSFRAALMPVLGGPGPLVELDEALLTDGPWCGGGSLQFDADLLRLRQVRLSVRLQASDPAVRGRDPAGFANPGHAANSRTLVEDVTVVLEMTPRNLWP